MKRQRAGRSKGDAIEGKQSKNIDSFFRPVTRSGAGPRREATIKAPQNDDLKNRLLRGAEAGTGTLEANILALLDTQGIKDTGDIQDDKLSFLEAVQEVFIASRYAKPPSRRLYKAAFSCLQESQSTELAFSSYRLLLDLEKAWSPLKSSSNFELEVQALYGHPTDITVLVPKLSAEMQDHAGGNFMVKTLLTLHFLVELWKRDFDRKDLPKERSFVNQQLMRLTPKQYSEFLRAAMHLSSVPVDSLSELDKVLLRNYVVQSAQSIITMAIQLDESEQVERDSIGTMVDLRPRNDQLASLLQRMKDSRQKLALTVKLLSRELPKNVKKHLVDEPPAACFRSMLESFSENAIARAVNKCMEDETLQLLLSHAFQASLLLQDTASSLPGSFKAAFRSLFPNLRDLSLHQDMLQALVVAEALAADK